MWVPRLPLTPAPTEGQVITFREALQHAVWADPSGGSTGAETVVAKTADYSILVAETRTVFTTEGALARVILSLPPWQSGLSFEFVNEAGFELQVLADPFSQIRAGRQITRLGGYLSASLAGSLTRVIAHASNKWVVRYSTGAWSVQT